MMQENHEAAEAAIRETIAMSAPVGVATPDKPLIEVDDRNPDRSVESLRDALAAAGQLYDRGVPVRLIRDVGRDAIIAQPLTADSVVFLAHRVGRPVKMVERSGEPIRLEARLPRPLASMYLDWRGEWGLPPLAGISSTPLLRDDGTIVTAAGYDAATGLYLKDVPDLAGLVPSAPTHQQAVEALLALRHTFRTFCFADAEATAGPASASIVDILRPPGEDESAFLAALLTAVCRPSLAAAPGVLVRAASVSGAGAGKGLLVRCMSIIAFGREPFAVTGGGNTEELEKRISAELIAAAPMMFLDNLNNATFRSDLLASAITERHARVRVLGRSEMATLNTSALIVLTGNGLSVSEDLARRFVMVELDPRTEHPEARSFAGDIRAEVGRQRTELLVALLTIWRWGRQARLNPGQALGSFEQWCSWVRDPLLALGCMDPARRVSQAKAQDVQRQALGELFALWWERHRDRAIKARDLNVDVVALVDPQRRGRQFVAARLQKLANTRLAGFVLTRQEPAGLSGQATYVLSKAEAGEKEHRGHRGHAPGDVPASAGWPIPMPSMPSMPSMPPAPHGPTTAEDLRQLFDERAAIAEFEGGLSRPEAEALALAELAALSPSR